MSGKYGANIILDTVGRVIVFQRNMIPGQTSGICVINYIVRGCLFREIKRKWIGNCMWNVHAMEIYT